MELRLWWVGFWVVGVEGKHQLSSCSCFSWRFARPEHVILSIEILTCVELNDSLGSVRVRVGDGGQLGVLIYRIVNLKQTENYNLFEQISPGKLFN